MRLATDTRLSDLVGGEADVAIRAGVGPWPGLDAVPLFPIDFTPMCTPSCLIRAEDKLGRSLVPTDLTTQPLISPDDDWWDIWFAAVGVESAGRLRTAGLRLDSQADEGHAAMGGQGFVLLTPAFWKNDIADGRLVQPFALTATAGYRYWLVIAPTRRAVPKIKRFGEWVLHQVAPGEPGTPPEPRPSRYSPYFAATAETGTEAATILISSRCWAVRYFTASACNCAGVMAAILARCPIKRSSRVGSV